MKNALITGCSEPTSLGAALALDLKQRGYRVFVSARRIETLAPLEQAGCEALALDVVDADSIAAAKKLVADKTGGFLDVLVNNAGVAGWSPLLDTDIAAAREMFEVNAIAPLAMVQAFAPLLVEGAKASGQKSVVVNVGSGLAWGFPWSGVYGATKAAVQALSEGMRREMINLGITAITLELNVTKTAMTAGSKPFNLITPAPSGYFSNWADIDALRTASFKKMIAGAPTAQEVAHTLGDAIVAAHPPPKMWLGASAFVFRFLLPLFPTRLLDSWIVKETLAALVPRP